MKRANSRIIFALFVVIISILYINTKKQSPNLNPNRWPTNINYFIRDLHKVTYFSYPDQNDIAFSVNELKNKVTVVDFFFTSCPMICPDMMRYMREIAIDYKNNPNVQFLSISVDPLNDTKAVINNYILRHEANFNSWYFLGSDSSSIEALVEKGFLLSADNLPGEHSQKFILINPHAQIVGYYDPFSKLSDEMEKLKFDINNILKAF